MKSSSEALLRLTGQLGRGCGKQLHLEEKQFSHVAKLSPVPCIFSLCRKTTPGLSLDEKCLQVF